MATILKANCVRLVSLQDRTVERKRPTKNRQRAMCVSMETLEPLELSLFSPWGEFLVDVLEQAPRLPDSRCNAHFAIQNRLEQVLDAEYSDYLDSVDSARFELPEDYKF